jgi:hypothetical protein
MRPVPRQLGALGPELVVEAGDHPGLVARAIVAAADAGVGAVGVPEPLGGRAQELEDVLGHVEVGRGAGQLEDLAVATEGWQVDRDLDHPDEEELGQEHRDHPLGGGPPRRRIADVPDLVGVALADAVDVVAQHQPVGRAHRRLGLVLVGAASQRQELADALEHAIAGRAVAVLGHRRAVGAGVDAALVAHPLEGRAVGVLAAHRQHLVDVLVGHLVEQHRHHLGPRARHHQRPRQLERARGADPLAEAGRGVGQRQGRRAQALAEPGVVLPRVDPDQLAQQRGLELGRQRGRRGRLGRRLGWRCRLARGRRRAGRRRRRG